MNASAPAVRAFDRDSVVYPETLRDLPRPPTTLWLDGDDSLLARPMVAIVGTREPSPYGDRVARSLATAFARENIVVVSGMARGIDAAAHEATLDAGGATVAVLGSGVDVVYPVLNRHLHERIAERGLLVSEMSPGSRPHRGSFPNRNRIIAALAHATIVVQAGHRSGALITATVALDLTRTVAAVPGPIDDARCAGSNRLLRDGAIVIGDEADALALVGATRAKPREMPPLDDDEASVWRALASGPSDENTLIARSGLETRRTLTAITTLELKGLIECTITGEIVRC